MIYIKRLWFIIIVLIFGPICMPLSLILGVIRGKHDRDTWLPTIDDFK